MRIKEIKDPTVLKLVLRQQALQGNIPNEKQLLRKGKLHGNFNWSETKQGDSFWRAISIHDYGAAYKLYNWEINTINALKE